MSAAASGKGGEAAGEVRAGTGATGEEDGPDKRGPGFSEGRRSREEKRLRLTRGVHNAEREGGGAGEETGTYMRALRVSERRGEGGLRAGEGKRVGPKRRLAAQERKDPFSFK